MSEAYLGLIERFLWSELGVGFEAAAIPAIDALTLDQLRFFREQWEAVDRRQHELMAQARTVSQEDGGPDPHTTERVADTRSTSALFSHPYNGLEALDLSLVKRQALFFSRVAVVAPRLDIRTDLRLARAAFVDYLKAMLVLRPLILDHTVVLLPIFGFCSDEIEGGAGIVRSACDSDPEIQKWIASERDALGDFARTAKRGDPFFDAGVRIFSALTYDHTFAATHAFVGGLYRQLLSDVPRLDRSRTAAVQFLDRIDLPGFANLTWADIKSVRDSEECLARWRADLQVAISSVDPDLPAEKFVERFDSQVQAQLARAALDLERELKRSSAMARFRKGGSSLVVSAVAGVAGAALGNPAAIWPNVLEVLRKDGPREAIRLMWGRKDRSAEFALRKHYVVFSSAGH